jgi:hypothetical protein
MLLGNAKAGEGIDEVVRALRSGNAIELSRYVDDNIELGLPGRSNSYSRAQAVMILRDFFSTNSVKTFDLKQKLASGSGQYCIGTLQTRSGSYRTTVFVAEKNGRQSIREIRFLPI